MVVLADFGKLSRLIVHTGWVCGVKIDDVICGERTLDEQSLPG